MTVREFREFERTEEWARWQSTILGGDDWAALEWGGRRWNGLMWDHCLAAATRIVLQQYRDGQQGEGLSDPNVRLQKARKIAELEMLSLGYAPPHFNGVAKCAHCGFVAAVRELHGRVIGNCDWCNFPGVLNGLHRRGSLSGSGRAGDSDDSGQGCGRIGGCPAPGEISQAIPGEGGSEFRDGQNY